MANKKDKTDHRCSSLFSTFWAIINYARREEFAHRKLQKTRRAYIQERTEQRENLKNEVARLDKLLKENSIDKDTYARLNKILKISDKQKCKEARRKLAP